MTTQENQAPDNQNLPPFEPNTENGKRCLSAFFAITLSHVFLPDVDEGDLAEDTVDRLLSESLVNGSIISGALLSLGLMTKDDLQRALFEALAEDPKNPSDTGIFQVALIMQRIAEQIPRMDHGLRDMQASLAKLQALRSHSS